MAHRYPTATSSDSPSADVPPTLFTYIVARDFGFAPNPFHNVCTLATCKPAIRKAAQPGDIVLGKASTRGGRAPEGCVVYAMRVGETLAFDDYWRDPRFAAKRPRLNGSRKQRHGDNIYHRDEHGNFVQADSHHSWEGGVVNEEHLRNDTSVDRVLIGSEFVYWGRNPTPMPPELVPIIGRKGVRQKHHFSDEERDLAVSWIEPLLEGGLKGRPTDWD
jgi:hypothetical protein